MVDRKQCMLLSNRVQKGEYRCMTKTYAKQNNMCIGAKTIEKRVTPTEHRLVGGMVSPDGQQCGTPLRHGVNEAINEELEYSVPLLQKCPFQFLESLWG